MGSNGSARPCQLAVRGMNCAIPAAPFGRTASHRSGSPARSLGQRTRLEGRSPPPTVLVRGKCHRLSPLGPIHHAARRPLKRSYPRVVQVWRPLVRWQTHSPRRARKQAVVGLCGALLVSFGSTTAKRTGMGPVPSSSIFAKEDDGRSVAPASRGASVQGIPRGRGGASSPEACPCGHRARRGDPSRFHGYSATSARRP